MIKEEINIYSDAKALSEGFTAFLQKLMDVYPRVNLHCLVELPPKVIFDYWAENCKDSIGLAATVFLWGDERCVPPENVMNNYGMTKDHLFDKVPKNSE